MNSEICSWSALIFNVAVVSLMAIDTLIKIKNDRRMSNELSKRDTTAKTTTHADTAISSQNIRRSVGLLAIVFSLFMVATRQFFTPADVLLTTRDAAGLMTSGFMFLLGMHLMRD